MTDGARSPAASAPRPPAVGARRPGSGGWPALTWLGALTVFAVVLVLLAWRMLAGNDPALGGGQPQQAAATPARRVLVRRMIRRTIVVTTDAPPASGVPSVAGAATGRSAPVASDAAFGAVPAPAPVTRSS